MQCVFSPRVRAGFSARPLDAATQQALRTLAPQLAEDPAADCTTALKQMKAALGADEKAR